MSRDTDDLAAAVAQLRTDVDMLTTAVDGLLEATENLADLIEQSRPKTRRRKNPNA